MKYSDLWAYKELSAGNNILFWILIDLQNQFIGYVDGAVCGKRFNYLLRGMLYVLVQL